jgi:Tfp pilus assembly protein PilN
LARRINLVPASERVRTTTNWGILGLVAGAIIVLFGLGLGYYLLSSTLEDRKQELTAVQQERQRVEAQAADLRQYELLASERARTEEVVQTVYAGRTLVADILDSISLVVPETVWFQSLSLSTAEPTATGAAGAAEPVAVGTLSIEGATYTFEEVAQVIVRLQLIRALAGVDLGSASVADESGKTRGFSIGAAVINTQDPETPLPVSQVEVEGL